jgi:hypothetical protein
MSPTSSVASRATAPSGMAMPAVAARRLVLMP